jgi:hypothetical protein
MAADYGRIHRLLKILALIQGGEGWTPRPLAQECGTTERTFCRDLRTWRPPGSRTSSTWRTAATRFARTSSCRPCSSRSTSRWPSPSWPSTSAPGSRSRLRGPPRAIAKVRGVLPPMIRRELEHAESNVSIRLAAASPARGDGGRVRDGEAGIARQSSLAVWLRVARRQRRRQHKGGRGRCRRAGVPSRTQCFSVSGRGTRSGGGRGEVRCLKLNQFVRVELTPQNPRDPEVVQRGVSLGQRVADDPRTHVLRCRAALRPAVRRDDRRHALAPDAGDRLAPRPVDHVSVHGGWPGRDRLVGAEHGTALQGQETGRAGKPSARLKPRDGEAVRAAMTINGWRRHERADATTGAKGRLGRGGAHAPGLAAFHSGGAADVPAEFPAALPSPDQPCKW